MSNKNGSGKKKTPGRTATAKPSDTAQSPATEDRPSHRVTAALYEFSGPLPPPEVLERYDRIIPGAAERILTMAESETRHRQDLERDVVHRDFIEARIGQFCGFGIGAIGLIGSAVVSIYGSPWAGSALGGITVGGLVSVFIYGRSRAGTSDQKPE